MEKLNQKLVPFISLCGDSEEAMNYYVSVFPDTKIRSIIHITDKSNGEPGKVLNGVLELMGQELIFMDMEEKNSPNLSWGISFYINCNSSEMFYSIFEKLSKTGEVMMGPEPVLEIRLVSWVTDKFGVTWQLVWE